MDADARIEALEAENERLRDELERLREAFGLTWTPPLELKLTGKEGMMLGRLLKGGLVTRSAFLDALYQAGPDDEPGVKIIDVFACKLRAKLKQHGIRFDTRWGTGYEMPREMIERFHELFPDPTKAAA